MKKIKTTPSTPQHIEAQKIKQNHIRLSVYPYESGYAISVAHPLRRLLLSSTSGYAPVGIKIDDVLHEFDSVRGMLEDVSEFIINLKNIRFKVLDPEAQTVELSYSFEGPAQIYGKDLSNDIVEVVTPENFLCTLNEDAKLNFQILLQKGIGYVPSEEIREELPEGFIPVDAFFTPVKKALYTIENVLVDDDPHYEKIVFEIVTDGQVEPLDALKEAYDVFMGQIEIFGRDLTVGKVDQNSSATADEGIFLEPLSSLELSARSHNCLEKAGIEYIGELLLMDKKELKEIKNLGKKSLDEIDEKLAELGVDIAVLSEEERKALLEKIESKKSKG
jgi:DNA-directed RNA polymerase subunit alpha